NERSTVGLAGSAPPGLDVVRVTGSQAGPLPAVPTGTLLKVQPANLQDGVEVAVRVTPVFAMADFGSTTKVLKQPRGQSRPRGSLKTRPAPMMWRLTSAP